MTATVNLTADEGAALAVLQALLGRARADAVRAGVRPEPLRAELVTVGARHLAVAAMRYLVEGGGYRERPVLRGGVRKAGRAWDGDLADGFAPRFTDASRRLWLEAAAHLPELAARPSGATADADGERRHRRTLRDMVAVKDTDTGDWIFFALAAQSLPSFRLAPQDAQSLVRKLRQGSPLAMLLGLDGEGTEPELAAQLAPLFAPPTVRILECVEDRLVAAWLSEADTAWATRNDPAAKTARWTVLGRVLHAYVDAADAARRLDLTRPVMRLARGLVAATFKAGGDATRAAVSGLPGVRTVRERDDLLGAIAWVTELGPRLLRLREVLAAERYGDERYAEAQVFVRMADDALAPARRRLDDLARALGGVVG